MTSSTFILRTVFALLASLGIGGISAQTVSPIEPEDLVRSIADVRKGGDLSKADLVRNLIELRSRRASGDVKLHSLDSLIQLGAAVLATRDRAIDTNANIGIWPDFDARAYGSKYPIFAGSDPDAIADPKVRDAYKEVLSKHKDTLTQFSAEKKKAEVAGESLLAAKRIMEEMDSPEAVARATEALSKLADDPWIHDTAQRLIFPNEPLKSTTDESVEPGGVPKVSSSTLDRSIITKKTSPPAEPEIAKSNTERSSSIPPLAWGAATLTLLVLLWLWLKNQQAA